MALKKQISSSDTATVTNAVKSGKISFDRILDKLQEIAFDTDNNLQALNALKEMKSWYDDAQKELVKSDMPARDVTDLLGVALSSIDKKQYVEVLKLCRERRRNIIRKRNMKFDVQAIVNDEKSKLDFSVEQPITSKSEKENGERTAF